MKFVVILFMILSCQKNISDINGFWKVSLDLQGHALPFQLEINKDEKTAYLYNSDEVHELSLKIKDQNFFHIDLPFDENFLEIQFSGKTGKGFYVKKKKDQLDRIKLFAIKLTEKSVLFKTTDDLLAGDWKVDFFKEDGSLEKSSLGRFKKNKRGAIQGTLITETGDYRFFEGEGKSNLYQLFGFDGQMNFVFSVKLNKDKFEGRIYSGNSWNRKIIGTRSNDFKLNDPEELTKFNTKLVEFKAKQLDGSDFLFDKKTFPNTPVILQVFGSWCPNCLDESEFLNSFLEKEKNLKVIAVSFERALNHKKAAYQIEKFKKRINAQYLFVVGSHDKDQKGVLEVLPFLENHLSYPTMIFLDKNKKIHRIHTGFSGPATGKAFEDFKVKFKSIVQEIL